MNAVSMTGTAHEAWWLPAHVAYRYVGVHPTLGKGLFPTLLAAQEWAGAVAAEPARKPLHPSFTQDLGTLALAQHAQGAHARIRSLVCSACRTQAGR